MEDNLNQIPLLVLPGLVGNEAIKEAFMDELPSGHVVRPSVIIAFSKPGADYNTFHQEIADYLTRPLEGDLGDVAEAPEGRPDHVLYLPPGNQ